MKGKKTPAGKMMGGANGNGMPGTGAMPKPKPKKKGSKKR